MMMQHIRYQNMIQVSEGPPVPHVLAYSIECETAHLLVSNTQKWYCFSQDFISILTFQATFYVKGFLYFFIMDIFLLFKKWYLIVYKI